MDLYSLQFRDKKIERVCQRGKSKFMQLSLQAGEGIEEHLAPLLLAVVILKGRIAFSTGNQKKEIGELEMLTLDANTLHAVEALEQSIVLLVLTPDDEEKREGIAQ
ncbi:hypothetical protein [Ferroacidibacillus organovorans]|uniref:Cupin 2 conserved barrel domain-containing protein n=1 Tax=Ferroacidibacillus organovorans TaxID=1765683 RepID=A0A117SXH7_9BACL|nr:hypothetical protein [Ferroacidibacillus organovorans]KUO95376.1 hypothetical protein ATW55_11010 [Ferroacidibacillus organovorans]